MQSVHLCLPTVSIQLMIVISIVTVSGGFMSSKICVLLPCVHPMLGSEKM